MNTPHNFATVIMAAGKGTRMKNPGKAKVMYEVSGKPMVEHVVHLAHSLSASKIIAIVGWQRDTVIAHLRSATPHVEFAVQDPQLGTGHAVMQTEPYLMDYTGDVLVLSGDVPLLRASTVRKLIDAHHAANAVATILTAVLDDATGYGRIMRNRNGAVVGIIEHKDATEEQRKIREINSGIYIFDCRQLFDALKHISPHNVQNEYYLTDVFSYFWKHHHPVSAVIADDANEIRGVNTIDQLKEAEAVLQAR